MDNRMKQKRSERTGVIISLAIIIAVFLYMVSILLMGLRGTSRYDGKRPYDFPNTVWRTENGVLEIYVISTPDGPSKVDVYGVYSYGQDRLTLDVVFLKGLIRFWDDYIPSSKVMEGDCVFSEEKMSVYISESTLVGVPNGIYEFVRYDLPESSVEDKGPERVVGTVLSDNIYGLLTH